MASTKLGVPYSRLYSRIQGSHPRSQNGGNRTLLTKAEEEAIFDWARDQLVQGKRVQSGEVLKFTIEMLRAEGRTVEPSKSWAKRFRPRLLLLRRRLRLLGVGWRDCVWNSIHDHGRSRFWTIGYW